MAYGKIKCDSVIYDNSGSDVEKTIASLAADPEGTAIKSTGESGTTKFLRVDGDGTCSWQVPPDTTYSVGDGGLSQNNFTNADHTKLDGIAASANNYAISADLLDEDDMATNSNTKVPSQQSVKAYTDTTFAPKAAPAFTGTATGVNLTLSGNLTVNGTTTTINAATLDVEDKNIELGKVSSPSDTTADGGGITLKGASDKTFNWVDATDAWTSSEHIHLGDSKKVLLGTGSDLQIWHSGTNGVIRNTTSGALYIQNQISDISLEAEDNILFKNYDGQTYARFLEDGACELYWDDTKKLETTTAGVTVSGSVTDDKGDVRKIPQNTQGSTYTLVAADAGKHILASGTVTIPNSVFAAGDAVTIVNNTSGDLTLTASVGTLYNTADAATGNRTLATRGMATILFASATVAYISGAGLS